jgi:hypothetical protein
MRQLATLLGLGILAAACTTVSYESPQLPARAPSHQTIAVLPFEMVLTGRMPRGITPAQAARLEEAESIAFQHALYDQLLHRSSATRRHPIRVTIQPVETTNRILADAGIPVRSTWQMEAEELAELLGVDAVLRTSVVKARYLSDGASYGIDVGFHILEDATDHRVPVPWGLTRTHDVSADSRLLAASDGLLLWKVAVDRSTDWSRPVDDVIVGITRKLAKKFPYRS